MSADGSAAERACEDAVEYEVDGASCVPLAPSSGGQPSGHVLHIEDFEPAVALSPDESDAYRRRFVTLFRQEGSVRSGGSAKVVRVTNIWGEAFALKVLDAAALEGEVCLDEPICSVEGALPEGDAVPAADGEAARIAAREKAFRREYRLQCSVSPLEGFPRVYGFGRVEGSCAIVMEWVEGITLSKAVRLLSVDDDGRLSPLTAARIGRDLFDVLMRLAFVEGGKEHRDISIGNVMVRTDRVPLAEQVDEGMFDVCLIDFGSAAATLAETGRVEAGAGATWDFAAPELLGSAAGEGRGETGSSSAADVYAAASVVWFLASGGAPHATPSTASRDEVRACKESGRIEPWRTAHAEGDVAAVLLREPEVAVAVSRAAGDLSSLPFAWQIAGALCEVDAALGTILGSCLSPSPAKRPSALTVRDALGSFAFHYADNIGRALRGEPGIPLVPGDLADGYGGQAQRRRTIVRVAGKAAGVVVAVATIGLTAALVGADAAPFAAPWLPAGFASGALVAAALALPFAGGALFRLRSRGAAGLVRATAGVAVGAVAAVGIGSFAAPQTGELAVSLAGALCAAVAGAWCWFAMDFAVPAPSCKRERRVGAAVSTSAFAADRVLEEIFGAVKGRLSESAPSARELPDAPRSEGSSAGCSDDGEGKEGEERHVG